MTRPRESDYTSHVAYCRALELYCDLLEAMLSMAKVVTHTGGKVYDITGAEPPPPDSGFAKL